jgi:hypothetical protein
MDAQMEFSHPSELDFGTRENPIINIVGKRNCCCGNEDWFHFGTRDGMEKMMNKFLYIQSLPPLPLMYSHIWGPEDFTNEILVSIFFRRLFFLLLTNFPLLSETKFLYV